MERTRQGKRLTCTDDREIIISTITEIEIGTKTEIEKDSEIGQPTITEEEGIIRIITTTTETMGEITQATADMVESNSIKIIDTTTGTINKFKTKCNVQGRNILEINNKI